MLSILILHKTEENKWMNRLDYTIDTYVNSVCINQYCMCMMISSSGMGWITPVSQ